MSQYTDFFAMVQSAGDFSSQEGKKVWFEIASDWAAEITIRAETGQSWSISVTDYHASLRSRPSQVYEVVKQCMQTLEGRIKLLESSVSCAQQARNLDALRPSVWELIVLDDTPE